MESMGQQISLKPRLRGFFFASARTHRTQEIATFQFIEERECITPNHLEATCNPLSCVLNCAHPSFVAGMAL